MKILLAVDGSEHSALASKSVSSRPWPANSQVRVVHVIAPLAFAAPVEAPTMALSGAPTGPYWAPAMMEARKELQQQAERMAQQTAQRFEGSGLNVDVRIREGDARTEIVTEAEEWDADLIVLGSHGYTGIKRWLLGSVAQSIVSHAPCSVEIARNKVHHGSKPAQP
jgi:nucleotide-binding universal stress UspA family protein